MRIAQPLTLSSTHDDPQSRLHCYCIVIITYYLIIHANSWEFFNAPFFMQILRKIINRFSRSFSFSACSHSHLHYRVVVALVRALIAEVPQLKQSSENCQEEDTTQQKAATHYKVFDVWCYLFIACSLHVRISPSSSRWKNYHQNCSSRNVHKFIINTCDDNVDNVRAALDVLKFKQVNEKSNN